MRYAQTRRGPVYLRLGKDDRRRVPGLDGAFDPERISLTRRGNDGLVLATGGVAAEAAAAVEALSTRGVSCSFGVVASLAPPPIDHLHELLREHPWVATVEAHVRSGGLGSIVADAIADTGVPVPLLRVLRRRSTRCPTRSATKRSSMSCTDSRRPQLERDLFDFARLVAMRRSSTVSLVLPAYRAADQVRDIIPEMIDEVAKLGAALEVIVVVNGPRDGTDEAAEDAAGRRPARSRARAPTKPGGAERCARGSAPRRATCSRTRTSPGRLPSVLRTAVALALRLSAARS